MKQWENWLVAWVELIESILTIVSFDFIHTNWALELCFYFTEKRISRANSM